MDEHHTVVSLCLVHQHLPKPSVKASISAYPIFLSRQSAGYHMKSLYKDQQHKKCYTILMRNEFLSELRIGCAYRDIMKAIVNKNALLIAFRFCPCNFLKCCLQVIWSPQLEVPKNFMQLGV